MQTLCGSKDPASAKYPPSPHVERMYALEEIQMKKEELYNLMAAVNTKYEPKGQNTRLLQDLSVQVKPRPNDPYWRRLRTTKRINDVLGITGILVSSRLFWATLFGSDEADPTEKKTDLGGNKQEQ